MSPETRTEWQGSTAPSVVVAMGGHAFIQPGERGTHEDHSRNARLICRELMAFVERSYRLVITHGNGPQVGDLLLRQELAKDELPRWPLDVLVAEDAGRGHRRLVPSPKPVRIIQAEMVREAVRSGNIVVAAGGGGIPVTLDNAGEYVGVEAVIDKDLTSSVLATGCGADLLVILTAVDGVYVDWGKPTKRRLGAVTMAECERYIDQGMFPAGSMGPKVEAIFRFLERGGKRGLITSPAGLREALEGRAGTHFIGRI
jgi:carbamate kinase